VSLVTALVNDFAGRLPLIGQYLPKVKAEGRTRPQWDIEAEVFAKLRDIPDVRLLRLNDRGDRDLSFNILSSNSEDLSKAVALLESRLRQEPVLANVSSEGSLPRTELRILPHSDQIARLGITVQQIAETVRVATIGDADSALPKISMDNRQIPIRVLFNTNMRTNLAAIKALPLKTPAGTTVPLASVADVVFSEGPSSIKRQDRNRVVTIGADLPKGVALDTASARFKAAAKEVKLPASVQFLESGDAKVQNEMVHSFGNAMLLGLLLVLVVLILLFKDVIQPFTILFSLPLAIGGVAAGLIVTGNALSMPVLIGILMLMGIVTKNAILLVDFAIETMHKGVHRLDAIVEAGRKRARPIVMTSIAMSAGMLPSALGVGEGGSFRAPMAIAVIGGIIVSTVLSLIVVPSFFIMMDDLSRLLGRLAGGLVGKKEDEDLPLDNAELSKAAVESNRSINALEERLAALEQDASQGGVRKEKGKVISISPLAAE
jgi:multidrug efflux pump subunit AcrB